MSPRTAIIKKVANVGESQHDGVSTRPVSVNVEWVDVSKASRPSQLPGDGPSPQPGDGPGYQGTGPVSQPPVIE